MSATLDQDALRWWNGRSHARIMETCRVTMGRSSVCNSCTARRSGSRDPKGLLSQREAYPAASRPEVVTDKLMRRIHAHVGQAPQSDDIAILAIQYHGPAQG